MQPGKASRKPASRNSMRPPQLSRDAEKALRKSEMHYRIVSELTTTFVFDLLVAEDGSVSLDFVSDNFYTFAGRSPEEARTFESLLSHIHPNDTGLLLKHLGRLAARPQSAEIECRAFVGDSLEPRWLSLCGKSEWDDEKKRVTVIYGAAKDITERKRAEEERAKVQNLLEASQRIAHIGSWEYEVTTGRTTLSEEMYRIAGLPVGSGITVELAQSFLPPADFLRARKAMEVSVDAGAPYSVDVAIQRPDGQKRIVHSEAEIVFDEYGKPTRVFGISQDITDRKTAQESLEAAEQITEGILNAIPAGVFWKDRNLRYLGCNRQFARDAGFEDPSAITGKDDYEIGCPRESADQYREIDLRVIETGSAVRNVEDSVKRGGEDVTDLASIVPLRGVNGEISGVLGTYIEITDRKRIEKALAENEKRLQESEAKYRKLIETAPEAIYVIVDEKVAFCNNHALEMLGYSREEMMGMAMERINHPEDWAQARERYRSRTSGKHMAKSVGRHLARDGRAIWIECVGEKIDWEGQDAVLYFSSDVTERKKAEAERLAVDKYLQQAQKLESLGVLAGGIAHDFNNMLMSIFGFTDLARSEVKDANVAEYLSQAMAGMQRARALTQQLLTFAKGGAPVRKVVDVAPLITETCQFALHGSRLKGSYDLQEGLWNCNIDRNQVGQVLQNIVINAVQSMPMGGTVDVSAGNIALKPQEHPKLKEGAYVIIRVSDQGIGMSKEMLSMIFDPFFTTKTEGHGLGLAISHSIMVRHGGAIDVESELGKGTTFSVYLPACGESEDRDSAPAPGTPRRQWCDSRHGR